MLTGQPLRDWLVWAVHNRKPVRRASTPARQGPPRDEDYKAWIRTLPCIACGIEGRSDAAHTGSDGGMSMKASDYSRPFVLRLPHPSTRRVPPRGQARI